ncbi:hypothetical protein [sulfur-oxidizing endosymbiont of Gigantopelta aegis]|uniref:DUF7931 domain-containing protein n=1 Tax=sulfur-oxidizing endosymbiont of Gigantopelta aegis TaxID=2794934 RepID=UPI0018DC43CA|nr:hypothetical protein [sulfur-oxidizing endosymbiont of Gigantopelta aegis]
MDLSNYILGETNELIDVQLRDELQQLILGMSQQAKHRILIFSHALDQHLFDNDALYEAIKTLAIASQRTYINILVQDARPMTQRSHRLLTLAQRLSSHIKLKITAKEHKDRLDNFIIIDDQAYIVQNNPERYEAYGNFYEPLKARYLEEQFTELWERGVIDSSLRRLSL